jgi:Leucine-rich repeat (LRR) protein
MSKEILKIELPKLPELDKEDVKAVRAFLPGKLLGRTAALLSLVLVVLGFAIAAEIGLGRFLGVPVLPQWAYWALIGLPFLAVVAQLVLEWRAQRNRTALQALAVKVGVEQTGYFRIGPYLDNAEDRTKFSRPDRAEYKMLDWLKKSTQVPLYLTGDSGSGKSSLLNAFVLPKLREQGWAVVQARAWQDPQGVLRETLVKLPEMRRWKGNENCTLREIVEDAAKRASDRLLLVLDQFEEFLILAKSQSQREFATFIEELQSHPVKDLTVLLVMRSDYQMLLEDIGLPLLRSGENLLQLARFQLSAANTFMRRSGLDLQPEALDRLLTSAAELDDTPGLVRPITLNVIGYVLASGKVLAQSLEAGVLVRYYIEQALGQPVIREYASRMLEQMITEQGTKQPCSEEDLVVKAQLRPAEVRAILNSLADVGLARPLDAARGVWELSHDFIARAVVRFLGRHRRRLLWRAMGYAAPILLAIAVLGAAVVWTWSLPTPTPDLTRTELGNYGVSTTGDDGSIFASGFLNEDQLSKASPLLARLGSALEGFDLGGSGVLNLEPLKELTALRFLSLRGIRVSSLESIRTLTALQTLDLSFTRISSLEPLKALTALRTLDLQGTQVSSLQSLNGLAALRSLNLERTQVSNLQPLKELTTLMFLDLQSTQVSSLEPLRELTRLVCLDLGDTEVSSLEPLKGLTDLEQLHLKGTRVSSLEPLEGLTRLHTLGLRETQVSSLEPLKQLTVLETLDVTGTRASSLEPLRGLTYLTKLDLRGTRISSLEPLKALTALQSLDLEGTQVSSLEPLRELTALESIYLGGTQVSSLEPLYDLPKLKAKNIHGISGDLSDRFVAYRKEKGLQIASERNVDDKVMLEGCGFSNLPASRYKIRGYRGSRQNR